MHNGVVVIAQDREVGYQIPAKTEIHEDTPSYAEAKKLKSLRVHTHCYCLRARLGYRQRSRLICLAMTSSAT